MSKRLNHTYIGVLFFLLKKEKYMLFTLLFLQELYAPKWTLGAWRANSFAGMMTPIGGSRMCKIGTIPENN